MDKDIRFIDKVQEIYFCNEASRLSKTCTGPIVLAVCLNHCCCCRESSYFSNVVQDEIWMSVPDHVISDGAPS